jgi:hypothetical protein
MSNITDAQRLAVLREELASIRALFVSGQVVDLAKVDPRRYLGCIFFNDAFKADLIAHAGVKAP